MSQDLEVRNASHSDLVAITRIYRHHVLHDTASFELEPPTLDEMTTRFDSVVSNGFPYLVALRDDKLLGYAYANFFRTRPAYRFTVENSIYIDPAFIGQGVGKRLLSALIEHCTRVGCRQMLAVIGDSKNTGSISLHASLGFRFAGVFRSSGWKFDRWLDTVIMQLDMGDGDRSPAP